MPRRTTPRTYLGVVVGFGVSWLGGLILGEYPFTGFTPIIGGLLLGVSVVGAQAWVEGDDPPPWAILVGAALAVWGIWRAAWIDAGAQGDLAGLAPSGGIGPLPDEAWWAMAAAALGGALRLVPKRRRPTVETPGDEDDGDGDADDGDEEE